MKDLNEIANSIQIFLVFKIGKEEFAIDVAHVQNILEVVNITKIPNTPDYINGIISYKNEAILLFDSNKKLFDKNTTITNNTCILILDNKVQGKEVNFGIMVDSVIEVKEISIDNILVPPEITNKLNSNIISGVFHKEERFTLIMDLDNFLNNSDLIEIEEIENIKSNIN